MNHPMEQPAHESMEGHSYMPYPGGDAEYGYPGAIHPAEDPVKLFVGQIPKDMDEDELRPYFSEFGPILELTVIRDKATKQHRGCAFLTYARKQNASRAIQQLHDKIKLPNAVNPIQIRPAESQAERENKIFVGMLPKTITELDLHNMFARYGQLKEIHIIRSPDGHSKGCAFVKFMEREAALLAIHEMHDTIPEGSTRPLVIKFADNKKMKGNASDGSSIGSGPMDGMMGGDFYGSGHPHMNYMNPAGAVVSPHGQMMPVSYMQFGSQSSIPPQSYMYYPGGGYYTGAGGYVMESPQQSPILSKASVKQLTGRSPSGSSTGSYDPRQQQQQQQQQMMMMQSGAAGGSQSQPTGAGSVPTSSANASRPPEGPPGANLFIYHLPRDLTDADLATLFAPFGNVVSAKVYVDKKTSESKGFGFVSYDAVSSAEAAIGAMNGFQIGTKRLKVQHKRTGMSVYGMPDSPLMMGGTGSPPIDPSYPRHLLPPQSQASSMMSMMGGSGYPSNSMMSQPPHLMEDMYSMQQAQYRRGGMEYGNVEYPEGSMEHAMLQQHMQQRGHASGGSNGQQPQHPRTDSDVAAEYEAMSHSFQQSLHMDDA